MLSSRVTKTTPPRSSTPSLRFLPGARAEPLVRGAIETIDSKLTALVNVRANLPVRPAGPDREYRRLPRTDAPSHQGDRLPTLTLWLGTGFRHVGELPNTDAVEPGPAGSAAGSGEPTRRMSRGHNPWMRRV